MRLGGSRAVAPIGVGAVQRSFWCTTLPRARLAALRAARGQVLSGAPHDQREREAPTRTGCAASHKARQSHQNVPLSREVREVRLVVISEASRHRVDSRRNAHLIPTRRYDCWNENVGRASRLYCVILCILSVYQQSVYVYVSSDFVHRRELGTRANGLLRETFFGRTEYICIYASTETSIRRLTSWDVCSNRKNRGAFLSPLHTCAGHANGLQKKDRKMRMRSKKRGTSTD